MDTALAVVAAVGDEARLLAGLLDTELAGYDVHVALASRGLWLQVPAPAALQPRLREGRPAGVADDVADALFFLNCGELGIEAKDIHVLDRRVTPDQLEVATCEEPLLSLVNLLKPQLLVVPSFACGQNTPMHHLAVGATAYRLAMRRVVPKVLFVADPRADRLLNMGGEEADSVREVMPSEAMRAHLREIRKKTESEFDWMSCLDELAVFYEGKSVKVHDASCRVAALESLSDQSAVLAKRCCAQDAELARLREENAALHAEVDAVRQSHSYRIGQVALAPVRLVRHFARRK